MNFTCGLDSSSGFDSLSVLGVVDAATAVSVAVVSALGFGDCSQGFKNRDGGNGDDDGGAGVDGEGEEGLRISASSLSRLQLSRAI